MAGVGHMQRICKDTFSVAGAVQETCSLEMLGGPGADFPRGGILEHRIFSFGKMTLRALRMTWPHFFVAGAIL